MTAQDQDNQNDGGLNTLAEAQDLPHVEGDGTCYQLESTEVYSFTDLDGAVVEEKDDKGASVTRARRLRVHHRSKRSWNFFSYKSDCWVWVTDVATGKLVVVDQLEAHVVHNSDFGENRKIEKDVSSVHARIRVRGLAVANPSICAWGCAENSGFGRWCSAQKCH